MKEKNRDFYLPLLGENEEVVNVTETVIAIRNMAGEVRVYRYSVDESGCPSLSDGSIVIVHHNQDLLTNRCLGPEGLPF